VLTWPLGIVTDAGTEIQVPSTGVKVTTRSDGTATGEPALSSRTVSVGPVKPAVNVAVASTTFKLAALVTDVVEAE
jgi:hypothetical protein